MLSEYITSLADVSFNSLHVRAVSVFGKKSDAVCGFRTPLTPPSIRVCAAQRGRDFEAPDFRTGYPFRFLEWGIKNWGSRLYLLLKIVADYEEAFI